MADKLQDKSLRALEYPKIREMLAGKCSCEDSARLAAEMEPYRTPEEVRTELEKTSDASRLSLRFGGPSFYGLKNTASALHRAKIGSALTMRELLDVAGNLSALRGLARYREISASLSTSLDSFFDSITPNKYIEDRITSAILSEEEMADSASSDLADIRRHIRACSARARAQLDKMIRSPSYQKLLQDPIVTIREGRFVVPVRAEHRAEVPGLVHDTSASGATVFVEPMGAVEANNELRVLQLKERKEIERILAELSAEVGGFADGIESGYRTAVALDFLFAKARLAFSMKAFPPVLNEEGHIRLENARHPLLDPDKAVPVTIELGGTFDTLVVTGPNTGGKTVALKTLGLLVLMAMSGLMIPAAETSTVPFVTQVLADIGDEQSIEQSLSTFSAHMVNIIDIIGQSGPDSLVLLDELGSGTDPVEGAALAVAILEDLRARGVRLAATTHYAELKVYALETPGVENASCEFDLATLRPTYRLLIGVPGRSNAFAISERLGLPKEIIGRAKTLVSSDNSRFEEVVQRLEAERQRLEQNVHDAERQRVQAETVNRDSQRMRSELEQAKEKELDKARRDAKRLLEQSRAMAQQVLDELADIKKKKSTGELESLREQARAQLGEKLRKFEKIADPVHQKQQQAYHLPRALRAGDAVLLTSVNKQGVVLSAPDRSGYAEVQAGIIRTRVPASELRLLDQKPVQFTGETHTKGVSRGMQPVKTELDLRGQNVEESLLEVDRFLDDAQLAGLGSVSIIHGKGTGVLRSAVQKHLRGHPAVKSFRLGAYGEGESGVTIVELK